MPSSNGSFSYGKILVDSGANINIIKKGFLPLGLYSSIEKCNHGCILANDSQHFFKEKIDLQFAIGDQSPIQDTFFLLEDSKGDVIMSCTAMKASGVTIDLPLERLTIKEKKKGGALGVCLRIGQDFLIENEKTCNLHSSQELTIPANTGIMLKVKTKLTGTLNASKNTLNYVN